MKCLRQLSFTEAPCSGPTSAAPLLVAQVVGTLQSRVITLERELSRAKEAGYGVMLLSFEPYPGTAQEISERDRLLAATLSIALRRHQHEHAMQADLQQRVRSDYGEQLSPAQPAPQFSASSVALPSPA